MASVADQSHRYVPRPLHPSAHIVITLINAVTETMVALSHDPEALKESTHLIMQARNRYVAMFQEDT